MAGRGGEDEEPAGTKAVPFANDGSFLEQFLAMQKQVCYKKHSKG